MAVDLYDSQALDRFQGCLGSDGCVGATQAAALVGVTRQRVCQAIRAGKLKATLWTVGSGPLPQGRGVWRIHPEDLRAWRAEAESRD